MSDPPMSRRRFLAATGGSAAALSGCIGAPVSDPGSPTVPDGPGEVGTTTGGGIELPVPESELEQQVPRDAIPAITEPVFAEDWSGVSMEIRSGRQLDPRGLTQTIEPRLTDDDPVVGVRRAGQARAYPFRVLNWHEVVNDELDSAFLVTYCPLCRTALTTGRVVAGDVTNFGVSGMLYRNALVMYDEQTESFWSQILARAIRGARTGDTLDLNPVTLTTWGAWKRANQDTDVLRPPPESGTVVDRTATRDYRMNPYEVYQDTEEVGVDGTLTDDRLPAKAEVLGLSHDGISRAYPTELLRNDDPIEDSVGGLPVVVTATPDGTPISWVREVNGEVLSFAAADETHLMGGASRWTRATGLAVDGPYEGEQLVQANALSPLFWFAWVDFHPDTDVYDDS